MSAADAKEYAKYHQQGMTYQQIAAKFGVSKQSVQQVMSKPICVKEHTVKFPGLRAWMVDNRVKVSELERMTGLRLGYALRHGRLDNTKAMAILCATGLTYEQAFLDNCA